MGKCDAQVTWKNDQPTTLSDMIFTIILLSVKIIEFAELCIDTNGTSIQYSAFQCRRELQGKTPTVLKLSWLAHLYTNKNIYVAMINE